MPAMDYSGLILDVTALEDPPDKDFLEKLGHPVLTCHGPAYGHTCPIVSGNCEMVDAAHGVIFQLDLDRPLHRFLLKRYQEVLDDATPIVAVVAPGQEEKYQDILRDVQVWIGEPSVAELDGFSARVESADDVRSFG